MTVYGRTGDVVTIMRLASLEDVEKLEDRPADTQDLEALENGSYVVVTQDDGFERLYHQAFLRATDGAAEIGAVIDRMVATQDAIITGAALAPPREPVMIVVDQAGQPYGSVRRCCNMCGLAVSPGMRHVERAEDWWNTLAGERCGRKGTS